MAKAPKTAAEIKAQKAALKEARKAIDTELAKFVSDHKAAGKAHAAAVKEANKVVGAAQKALDAAGKKLEKATVAAAKGIAKIDAQLAALQPAATV